MYPAVLIAYAFVKKGIEDGNPVTQMKLQKLVYFAHGLHLAQGFGPLIEEKFQAWKFGPVVPRLYQVYKFYGSDFIDDTTRLFWTINNNKESLEFSVSQLNERAKKTIDITWDLLRDVDAIRLSAWTHEQGSPWEKHFESNTYEVNIPNKDIEEYFKGKFVIEQ